MTAKIVTPGPLSLIATGLQSRLQLVFPPTRFQWGFMPPRLTPREWSKLVNRTPFIGLGWNDIGDGASGRTKFSGQSNWTVYLVVENKSGVQGRYLGDAQGNGLFDVVQAAIIALHGFTVPDASGGFVGSCTVKRASNAFAEGWEAENQALGAIDVSVGATFDVPSGLVGGEAAPDLFAELAASWVFPDLGAQFTSSYPQDAAV